MLCQSQCCPPLPPPLPVFILVFVSVIIVVTVTVIEAPDQALVATLAQVRAWRLSLQPVLRRRDHRMLI